MPAPRPLLHRTVNIRAYAIVESDILFLVAKFQLGGNIIFIRNKKTKVNTGSAPKALVRNIDFDLRHYHGETEEGITTYILHFGKNP